MPNKKGADAIVVFDGRVLMVLRDNIPGIPSPNMWNMPGGGIDDGEKPEEAVKRELLEEIRIRPKRVRILGATNYDNRGAAYRFFVELDKEEADRVALGNEGQEIRWFTPDELKEVSIAERNKRFFDAEWDRIKKLIEGSKIRPEYREGAVR